MANAVQLPAHLMARSKPSTLAQSLVAGLGGNNPPYISIAQNRFTFVDPAGNKKAWDRLALNVIIVDGNPAVSKTYYDVAYDPNAEHYAAPACWSDNGVGPSSQSSKPQSGTCAACPHNAWGSAMSKQTGKPTKACNDTKKIAVMVPEFENRVFLLRIPPASLKNLKQYATSIGSWADGDHVVVPEDLITTIEFEGQGILVFKAAGFVDAEQYALIDKLLVSGDTDALVGRNDTVHQGLVSSPPVRALPAPQAFPQPQAPQQFAPLQQAPQAFPQPTPQMFAPSPTDAQKAAYAAAQQGFPQPPSQAFPAPMPQAAPKLAGRPRKASEAPQPAPQAFPQPQPAPQMFAPAPQPVQPVQQAAQFGMSAAPAPNADLAAALLAAMGV